jgi:16S rRNA (guanine966-N2)-methyltransferase
MRAAAKKQQQKPGAPKRVAQQVRIIGGQWKRTPLAVIEAEGLRPTPDRVRETVFNWLNHLLDGSWQSRSFLDLFAGTGALGFEAASRGAAQVHLVESHTPAYRQLEAAKTKLQAAQVSLQRGDALSAAQGLAARGQRYDVIFLDPPFQQGWLAKILPHCADLLKSQGFLYVESEMPLLAPGDENMASDYTGWTLLRADQAGSVYFHILQRNILSDGLPENQA